MRAVVQRVRNAAVTVGGETVAAIGPGLCVLVGVTHGDTGVSADKLADKLWGLRIFDDDAGVMNRSAADASAGAGVLVVSQFTLYGDTTRGRRPSWSAAAPPDVAEPLVERVATGLEQLGATVGRGRFGAEMDVALVNDGPVTLIIET